MFTNFLYFWLSPCPILCYNTNDPAFFPKKAKTMKRTDVIVKRKQWAAALVALVLLLALPFTAAAETFSTEDFSIEIPDGMYQFGPDTPLDDPNWALAGVGDPQSKLEDYREMNGIAELVTQDGETSILIMKNQTDASKSIFTLKDLSEEEKDEFLDGLMQSRTEEITVDKYYLDIGGQPFYRLRVDGAYEGQEYHEVLYGTIINGYSLNFDIYGGDVSVTQEQEDMLLDIVESISFTEILETPDTSLTSSTTLTTLGLLALLVLVILIPVLYFPLKNRRDKKQKAKLAEELSQYHKTHGDSNAVQGEMRFANSTDCTKEAIHDFSIYQSYIKNLGSLVVGVFLCAAALVVSFVLDGDWWIKLLAVGIAVYYGYKIFNMPHAMEKVQRRVYDRGVSSTAHYAFYDEAFRVSGIQSASVFPYFQITDLRKNKHYLYLYYGPENAYMVDLNGFSMGTGEEFVQFITEKTGKKL